MDKITQEAYHRQRILKWAGKHGATEAANRYHVSRKTVYKWLKRYDGSINSLKDRSRRPHHMPRQQTQGEWKLVKRYAGQHKSDLIRGYDKAKRNGYTRSYGCFKRTASKLEGAFKEEKTAAEEQTLSARRLSGTKGAGGR